eukprot:gnl/TRDRNA2_/TRDRNA2_135217_c0_seq1.p1 gnl/TRDRNA2_/TRDRNA2_135217_c0~~gnl/TRDRNA2_/TRDRNA2_135217_c0_seq1.p1  ORF type:complete len:649 (+),score=115.53 gnl/TRDRNA2_/TRDRNA2_135217_c0_seq1:32-1948(+)
MPLQRLDDAAGVRGGFRPKARSVGQAETSAAGLSLPNERAAATLRPDAAQSAHAEDEASLPRGKVLRTYKWRQHYGEDEVTEFDEAHFALEGTFAQNSSAGNKEYQDRLRAIHLAREGRPKAEIAKILGRSEKFVAKWWQLTEKELPVPWGVHAYMTKEMGRNSKGVGKTNNAVQADSDPKDTATWWRDVEVKRKFAEEPQIYDEILQNAKWENDTARTRDFASGAYHLRYDRYGNIKWEGHQKAKYTQGTSPAFDKCIQKLFAEYGIADRTSGILLNWYPDGSAYLGSHRHDCWTALFSFGDERILTIDKTPLLMQHGDLCIFGTQRHGVPVMPEITSGRITVVFFFYPDNMQKQKMWQTVSDPETMAPSRPLVAMLRDKQLSADVEREKIVGSEELRALEELGFGRADAEAALRASRFDVERAAEMLLYVGQTGGADPDSLQLSTSPGKTEIEPLSVRTGRFCRARVGGTPTTASSSGSTSGSSSSTSCSVCDAGSRSTTTLSDDEAASVALAMQLEEMEADERQPDPAMIAAQFEEYEERFKMEDAENWNGHGDLMHSTIARDRLTLEGMDKTTIYSVGHGDMFEKDFLRDVAVPFHSHSLRPATDRLPRRALLAPSTFFGVELEGVLPVSRHRF